MIPRMSRINVLKLFDAIVGGLLCAILPRPYVGEINKQKIKNVLLIRPGGIGDAVLLIPTIKLLKTVLPDTVIDVLAENRNCDVFLMCPDIRNMYRYDVPKEFITVFGKSYDLLIDTEQLHKLSAVTARAMRAPISIGFSTNMRKKLFSHQVTYNHDEYEVFSFLQQISPFAHDTSFDPDKPFLQIPREADEHVINGFNSLANVPMVAIFPGSTINERKWGADRFHQTALSMHRRGCGIIVVGNEYDCAAGNEIVSGLSGAYNLCGKLSLPETAAVLKKSALLITGDSGIMHIGYGLGIKIVALFGPGREKKWAPRGRNCRIINKHLACSPCTTYGYTPKCPRNAECMKNITVDEVVTASLEMLEVGSSK